MEDKIVNRLFDYAKKDGVNNMSVSFFSLTKEIMRKDHYNRNSQALPSGNHTLYEIGSLTKLFTALVYGIMQFNNEISINDPVRHYFGERVNKLFDHITIKDLLAHTSGLPRLPGFMISKTEDLTNPYQSLHRDELYEYLKRPGDTRTGNKYAYSNLGYGILGELLSFIHQKPYVQVIKEKLLIPLHMQATDVITNMNGRKDIAAGFNEAGDATPYWNNDILAGAGCFLSNIDEMTSFLLAHFPGNSNIPLPGITDTRISKNMSYGWHIKNSFFSRLLGYSGYYWHNGMTGGFSAYACINKVKKNGLVILTNKPVRLDSYFYHFSSYF